MKKLIMIMLLLTGISLQAQDEEKVESLGQRATSLVAVQNIVLTLRWCQIMDHLVSVHPDLFSVDKETIKTTLERVKKSLPLQNKHQELLQMLQNQEWNQTVSLLEGSESDLSLVPSEKIVYLKNIGAHVFYFLYKGKVLSENDKDVFKELINGINTMLGGSQLSEIEKS